MPTLTTLVCTACGNSFEREAKQLASSRIHNVKNVFCGRSCSISYQNKHIVKKNQKVSKLEVWIQTRIKETFPNLELLCNSKEVLLKSGELDLYIPKLKLAFEIQGISHFEPIFGQEKLENEQKNDQDKRNECQELGITLVEINARTFKTFRKNFELITIVEKVLNTIKEKLNEKSV